MPTARRFGGSASTMSSPMMIRPSRLRDEAGDDAQQGGLAAAGGAEQGDDLAALDVEIDVLDRERAARIAVGDGVDDERTAALRFSHDVASRCPKEESKSRARPVAFRCEVWHCGAMTSKPSICDLTATTLARAIAKARTVLARGRSRRIWRTDCAPRRAIGGIRDSRCGGGPPCRGNLRRRSPRRSVRCTACPWGSRTSPTPRGLRPPTDRCCFAISSGRGRSRGRAAAARRRDHSGKDQHAGIRLRCGLHQQIVRTDAQSVRSRADLRRIVRRLRRRGRGRHGAAGPWHRFRRLGAHARKFLRCRLDPADARPHPVAAPSARLGHARHPRFSGPRRRRSRIGAVGLWGRRCE